MPVQTACSACSAKLKVKDELVGKAIKCPKCGKVFKALAEGGGEKSSLKAGAATKPAGKQPPAAWDDGGAEEEASSPWDKNGKNSKAGGSAAPKSNAKPPVKAKSKADDDDEDDDDADEDMQFDALLAATLLPDSTKKMIQGELALREKGVWVGQPDPKMTRVRGIGKAFLGVFVVTFLCVFVGVAAGSLLESNWWIGAAGAAGLWVLLTPVVSLAVLFLEGKKARGTAYVITSKRCIVFKGSWFGGPSLESFYPDLLQHMRRMQSWFFGGDAGDIVFRSVTTITTTYSKRGGSSTSSSTAYFGFLAIRDLDKVERMIRATLLGADDDDDDDEDDDDEPKKKKKR